MDEAVAGQDTRECPFCAETIKAKAVVCRFCGRDVEPVAQTSPSPSTAIPQSLPPQATPGFTTVPTSTAVDKSYPYLHPAESREASDLPSAAISEMKSFQLAPASNGQRIAAGFFGVLVLLGIAWYTTTLPATSSSTPVIEPSASATPLDPAAAAKQRQEEARQAAIRKEEERKREAAVKRAAAQLAVEQKAGKEELRVLKRHFKTEKNFEGDTTFYTHRDQITENSYDRKYLSVIVRSNGSWYWQNHYYADGWLFHTKVKAKIGDDLVEGPEVETFDKNNHQENGSGSIWETIDYMEDSGAVPQEIAKNADKTVRIQFIGREYTNDITLSRKDKQAIKESIRLAELLTKYGS